MKLNDKGEEYINKFPNLKKWINECICCHRKGYNPKLPDEIFKEKTYATYYIKKYFKPLYVNDKGLCEVCSKLLS